MMNTKDYIALNIHSSTYDSTFSQVRRILKEKPEGLHYLNTESLTYEIKPSRFSVDLDELNAFSEAFLLIRDNGGIDEVEEWLASAESIETEFASRLGCEYKRSSTNPEDPALILHDDGHWYPSKGYTNSSLNSYELKDVEKLRNALHKMQKCLSYQAPVDFIKHLLKKNGDENGWKVLKEMFDAESTELNRFGFPGNQKINNFLKAYEVIQRYGGPHQAMMELNRLRIPRWITPEITNLESAFRNLDPFMEKPKCNKGLVDCKRLAMGKCRPTCNTLSNKN